MIRPLKQLWMQHTNMLTFWVTVNLNIDPQSTLSVEKLTFYEGSATDFTRKNNSVAFLVVISCIRKTSHEKKQPNKNAHN